MPSPDSATAQPVIDRVLSNTGSMSPAILVALVTQPALTALIAFLHAVLHIVNWLAPPGTEMIELIIGVPLLLGSIFAYGYTIVFITAYGFDMHATKNNRRRLPTVLAAVALTAQLTYIVIPVERVYGPSTFQEVLFSVDDLLPLAVAALATVIYIGMRTNRLTVNTDT